MIQIMIEESPGKRFPADKSMNLNEQLALYKQLLLEWNERMDLTNVPADEVEKRHFKDSLWPLEVENLIPQGARLVDVGTGAGFPGLPIAIARPDTRVTLLEAQGKRCQFLTAVKDALKLENVMIIQDRAENLGRDAAHRERYDIATARAVAPLNVLCEYLLPLVRVGGAALCWKGPAVMNELSDAERAAKLLSGGRPELLQPAEQGEYTRILVRVPKLHPVSRLYPRKNGTPAKSPLK